MKKPKECATIEDIRKGIDAIDKQLVDLLGKRLHYIREIVRFKKDEEDILARKRYAEVLLERRKWAEKSGLDPDVIENMYISLIHYFIEVQKKALMEKLSVTSSQTNIIS
jgi:isochorismate pyruvate lyase